MTKVLVAFPPEFLAQIDKVAKAEHRNRSDLLREAARRYVNNYVHEQHARFSAVTTESRHILSGAVQ